MTRELRHHLPGIERAERHRRVVSEDLTRVETERTDVEQRRAAALADAQAAEAARIAAGETVTKASTTLTEARLAAELESEGLALQRATAAAAAERRRATTAELRRIEDEYADVAARIERHRFEAVEITTRIEQLRESIAFLEQKADRVAAERENEEQEISGLLNQLEQARQQADALSSELSEINRRAAAVRDSRGAIEVQRAEAQARLTFVRENCSTELNQSLEELAREQTPDEHFDLDAGQARVEELRTRIEGFGAVNMMALEELNESEDRLLFLTGQRQDILEGISSTEEAYANQRRHANASPRRVEKINKNFGGFSGMFARRGE